MNEKENLITEINKISGSETGSVVLKTSTNVVTKIDSNPNGTKQENNEIGCAKSNEGN
jgi:hypothetical protein